MKAVKSIRFGVSVGLKQVKLKVDRMYCEVKKLQEWGHNPHGMSTRPNKELVSTSSSLLMVVDSSGNGVL